MVTTNTRKPRRLTASSFEALPNAEKDRIYNDIDARAATIFQTGKPLTARQKKAVVKARKKMGRPMLGKHGAKIVSVTVEKDLLKRADAYAKANGMKRSELFAASVREKIAAK
jgi:uncharacterized protein (DUF4415 family)